MYGIRHRGDVLETRLAIFILNSIGLCYQSQFVSIAKESQQLEPYLLGIEVMCGTGHPHGVLGSVFPADRRKEGVHVTDLNHHLRSLILNHASDAPQSTNNGPCSIEQ